MSILVEALLSEDGACSKTSVEGRFMQLSIIMMGESSIDKVIKTKSSDTRAQLRLTQVRQRLDNQFRCRRLDRFDSETRHHHCGIEHFIHPNNLAHSKISIKRLACHVWACGNYGCASRTLI
jgi:hypothetical protein